MTLLTAAGYGAGTYLIVRGLAMLVKRGKGPEGWDIRVYPFTMALWAVAGAAVAYLMQRGVV
jgi:hypothetical protein